MKHARLRKNIHERMWKGFPPVEKKEMVLEAHKCSCQMHETKTKALKENVNNGTFK